MDSVNTNSGPDHQDIDNETLNEVIGNARKPSTHKDKMDLRLKELEI